MHPGEIERVWTQAEKILAAEFWQGKAPGGFVTSKKLEEGTGL
jgi:hypothetical protein